jgi:RND family efflux transporter MFP subunit
MLGCREKRFLSAALLAWLGFSMAACSHKAASQADAESAAIPEVTLTRVVRGDISRTLLLSGTIAAPPNQDVRVSSLVPGRIALLKVAEGDRVQVGQLVAQIDDRPIRDQLQQAEAATAQARANLENAKLTRARNENLFERGIAARKELEDARTQESVAAAALRQSEAALSLGRLQLTRTEVKSPLTGTVVKRFVSVGEQVDGTAAQPIIEVANLTAVELIANVPANYLAQLRPNRPLSLTSEVFPGKTLTGRVVVIPAAVDPATNAGQIRIRIANSASLLRLGMFLSAQVPIETHAGALVVPPQAIYRDEQGHAHVYKVSGEQAAAAEVGLGIETPQQVELLNGVQAGDTVILDGGYGLGDKSKVKVKGQAKP